MSSDNGPDPIASSNTPSDPDDPGADAVRKHGGEPAKRHGDALLEGNGSRQGSSDRVEDRGAGD